MYKFPTSELDYQEKLEDFYVRIQESLKCFVCKKFYPGGNRPRSDSGDDSEKPSRNDHDGDTHSNSGRNQKPHFQACHCHCHCPCEHYDYDD